MKISISSPAVVIAAHMHRNPVKRGLVISLEQWRWSSYRDYRLGEPGPVKIGE
jgi:hypothetical protein